MDEIDILLGSDTASDGDALADELVRADFAWIDQLVRLRKQTGMTQQQVAQAMGRSQSVVSDIETMNSDPRLSSLRRYALAIGAVVKHRVMLRPADHPLVTPARVTTASGGEGTPISVQRVLASGPLALGRAG